MEAGGASGDRPADPRGPQGVAPDPRGPDPRGIVFYDGDCGLCHGFVRFLLRVDRRARFRIAPLGGDLFRATVPEAARAGLPDSVVLARGHGILVRSDAVLAVLEGLGGAWPALAAAGRVVPRALRDRAYDAVAARRARWFAKPTGSCPVLPPGLRGRVEP